MVGNSGGLINVTSFQRFFLARSVINFRPKAEPRASFSRGSEIKA